jgi:hypothetical protein
VPKLIAYYLGKPYHKVHGKAPRMLKGAVNLVRGGRGAIQGDVQAHLKSQQVNAGGGAAN